MSEANSINTDYREEQQSTIAPARYAHQPYFWARAARWLLSQGEPNSSGVIPLEYKCIVRPEAAEVDPAIARAKKAGLQIPQEILEREFMAQICATFIAAGGNAFEDWKDRRLPKPGERVLMAKYAGVTIKGADGEEYRMLNDKDIGGIITAEGVGRI